MGLILTIIPLILLVTLIPAYAQSEEATGILPDNFLWTFDVAFDNLFFSLASDPSEKSNIGLDIAGERLLETKDMISKNKVTYAEKSQREHDNILKNVEKEVEKIDRENKTTKEKFRDISHVTAKMTIHKEKITELKNRFAGNIQSSQVIENLDVQANNLQFRVDNKKNIIEIQYDKEHPSNSQDKQEIEDKIDDDIKDTQNYDPSHPCKNAPDSKTYTLSNGNTSTCGEWRAEQELNKIDTDGDGIPDHVDLCKFQPENENGFEDTDGCPDIPTNDDADGDGIKDSQDICPTQKETFNNYKDNDGCPDTPAVTDPDTDGDGIKDSLDNCPTQKETINNYKDNDGCPDTPPPTPVTGSGMCNCVVFRIDDIQDDWIVPAQIAVMDQFKNRNVPASVGPIMNIFGSDPQIVNYVKSGYDSGHFEIFLHGWNHENHSELSLAKQRTNLKLSQDKLASQGMDSNVWTPPYGTVNSATFQALGEGGIKIFTSADWADNDPWFVADGKSDIKDSYGMYHMPDTSHFYNYGDSTGRVPTNQILSSIDSSINTRGWAVVTMHPQEFTKANGSVDQTQINDLNEIIDYVQSQGYKIKTFNQVVGHNTNFIGILLSWFNDDKYVFTPTPTAYTLPGSRP